MHQKLHFAPYLRCNGINVQKSFPASRLLNFISFNPELKWNWGQTRSFCSLSGKIDNHFPKSLRFMINKLVPYFSTLQWSSPLSDFQNCISMSAQNEKIFHNLIVTKDVSYHLKWHFLLNKHAFYWWEITFQFQISQRFKLMHFQRRIWA